MELVSIGEDPCKYGYEYDIDIVNDIKKLLNDNHLNYQVVIFWKQIIDEIKKDKYFKKYDLSWMLDIEFK